MSFINALVNTDKKANDKESLYLILPYKVSDYSKDKNDCIGN